MMQAADGGDNLAVLLERLHRSRERIVLTRCRDLIIQRMNTVGKVDERTPSRRLGRFFGRAEGNHAFEHWEGDARPHGT